MGFALEDSELQTTPGAAARELAGKRVLALVMSAIVPDLDGLELVGDHAEAVLIGGCDETLEPNQIFSYMNLARAFDEIQMGASLFCLHKNKWWQTSRGPMLDSGAFVAGLEYATDVDAVLIGGCDETVEPNQVFSYMNLARAFEEIRLGAAFYCLHKNKWWQTSRGPMLDLSLIHI